MPRKRQKSWKLWMKHLSFEGKMSSLQLQEIFQPGYAEYWILSVVFILKFKNYPHGCIRPSLSISKNDNSKKVSLPTKEGIISVIQMEFKFATIDLLEQLDLCRVEGIECLQCHIQARSTPDDREIVQTQDAFTSWRLRNTENTGISCYCDCVWK